jgi:hypothetical protein
MQVRFNAVELVEKIRKGRGHLELGKSSKDWKKVHAQLGEHNCRRIGQKGRSGPLNFHVQIAAGERIGRE